MVEDGRPAPGYRRIVAEPLIQVEHLAIAWNEGLRVRVPAPVWERVGSLVHAIETGALEVPRAGF